MATTTTSTQTTTAMTGVREGPARFLMKRARSLRLLRPSSSSSRTTTGGGGGGGSGGQSSSSSSTTPTPAQSNQATSVSHPRRCRHKRSVRIPKDAHTTIYYYDDSNEDNDCRWYKPADFKSFRHQQIQDAKRLQQNTWTPKLQRFFQNNNNENNENNENIDNLTPAAMTTTTTSSKNSCWDAFVGLEIFVSRELAEAVPTRRTALLQHVLEQQQQQRRGSGSGERRSSSTGSTPSTRGPSPPLRGDEVLRQASLYYSHRAQQLARQRAALVASSPSAPHHHCVHSSVGVWNDTKQQQSQQ